MVRTMAFGASLFAAASYIVVYMTSGRTSPQNEPASGIAHLHQISDATSHMLYRGEWLIAVPLPWGTLEAARGLERVDGLGVGLARINPKDSPCTIALLKVERYPTLVYVREGEIRHAPPAVNSTESIKQYLLRGWQATRPIGVVEDPLFWHVFQVWLFNHLGEAVHGSVPLATRLKAALRDARQYIEASLVM